MRPPAGPEVVVLTGFLGSGKTTLLRDLLASGPAADTAVIVNEVGEIGLDGALLREVGGQVVDGIAMTMLAGGCVCCQLGGDLAPTVEALLAADRPAGAPPLARIVLETSGISRPGPILRQLAVLGRYRLRAAVVATYDPIWAPETGSFAEAAAQWAGAHRIVVTKPDLVEARRFAAAAAEAAAVNPLAEIVAETDRAASVARAFAPPPAGPLRMPAPRLGREDANPRLSTRLLRQEAPVAYDDLAAWLDNLAGHLGSRLLRLKGLVAVATEEVPLLVQSVGTLFSPPRPFRGPVPEGGFLVVIGLDLEGDDLVGIAPGLPFRTARPGARPPAEALAP